MFNGQPIFSFFGWWVAWVYSLSITGFFILSAPGPVPMAIQVAFCSSSFRVNESQRDGLRDLHATLTMPAPYDMDVPLLWVDDSAVCGRDYRVCVGGAVIHFEQGAKRGAMRMLHGTLPDITIVDDETFTGEEGGRMFRLQLQPTEALAVGNEGRCTVTITDDDIRAMPDEEMIGVRFATSRIEVEEKAVGSTTVDVHADSVVNAPTRLGFTLRRIAPSHRTPLEKRFERVLQPGARSIGIRLADVLTPDEMRDFGVEDDLAFNDEPEKYEIAMEVPRHPLIPSDPRTCLVVATNDDELPKARIVLRDASGTEIDHVDPRGTVQMERTGLSECDVHERITLGVGRPAVMAHTRAGEGVSAPLSVAALGGDDGLMGTSVEVSATPVGGRSASQERTYRKAPYGPHKPGDCIIILVNNERLHEPGDRIIEEVRNAIASHVAEMYGQAVIVLNRRDKGEDLLTPAGGRPEKDKMFRPFECEHEDVAGQLTLIEEAIRMKREVARNPELRAIVIWPERNLISARGLQPVQGPGVAPLSFLFPDADPISAGSVRESLVPVNAKPGEVTARSPKEAELRPHLTNVINKAHEEAQTRSSSGPSD